MCLAVYCMCNLVIVRTRIQLQNMIWHHCHCPDIPTPVVVRAEVTADNTSISIKWQWSRQGLLTCVDLVRVHYRPEGGSLMMYTVSNTTATSATLPNLQCNTEYTIWVYARSGLTNRMSVPRMISLPARGMYIFSNLIYCSNLTVLSYHSSPSHSH